ncbi:MAG: amidohydrolase [Paracoccaceae bacterium]
MCKTTKLSLSALLATTLALPVAAAENLARLNGTADYALINGFIYTMDSENPTAQAIAIEGNKISYVGDASGLASQIGFGTEVIDLKGKMVMPGFVEGHIHTVAGAIMMNGVDLQTDDKEELFNRIRTYAAETDGDAIFGFGVRFNVWTDGNPTAAMLDEIESERPIYLWAIDGHAAWVNSKALELAGVDKDTPDTVPGFSMFERDADGNPTGWLIEIPAQMQVFSALADIDADYVEQGILSWAPRLSAAGITTTHDLGVQGFGQSEGYQVISDIAAQGDLPFRVQGTYYWNDAGVDPLPIISEMRERFSSDLVTVRYLKINLDGGDAAYNGLYTTPYKDKPEVVVSPIIPYDVLFDVIQRADAAGINTVCHCFGDLAVRKYLDAVEAAIATNPDRDRRNVVSHGTMVHPDDRPRFAELDVTYDTSGAWFSLDPVQLEVSAVRLGMERVNQNFPMRQIADLGGNISFGSDWPAAGYQAEYRPLRAVEMAVTRQPIGKPDHPLIGGEEYLLTLEQALYANTLGAATGMDMDGKVGSLEVGKMADLIVLDQNLFEISPYKISGVKVLYTVMNGELVYQDE